MEATHTPGPWRDNAIRDCYGNRKQDPESLATAVWTADSETPICSTGFSVGRYHAPAPGVMHANAILIAAAPLMADALKSALALLLDGDAEPTDADRVTDEVIAALVAAGVIPSVAL